MDFYWTGKENIRVFAADLNKSEARNRPRLWPSGDWKSQRSQFQRMADRVNQSPHPSKTSHSGSSRETRGQKK